MQQRATEYFDTRVGMLLDALDETGLANETLLVFTTDHGPGLPGVKCNLNDRGLGVAMIVRGPGGFTGGQVSDALVTHMDLLPTWCEVAGIPTPDGLQGRSLVPLVTGAAEHVHDVVFGEQGYHGKYIPLRSVRSSRYRYVRRLGPDQPALHFSADGGEAFELLKDSGLERIAMPGEQLFDVIYDPPGAC